MERASNPSDSSRPPRHDRRDGNPFLPASHRDRRGGPLLTTNLQNRRTQNRSPAASSDRSSRSSENIIHTSGHFPHRPSRKTATASHQRGRHDPVSRGVGNISNDNRPHREESDVGFGAKHHYGDDLRSYVLDRSWTYHMGLHL